jgi:hypothetical protein
MKGFLSIIACFAVTTLFIGCETTSSSRGEASAASLRGKEAISPPAPAFPNPTIWDVGNIISINPGPGGFVGSSSGRAGR